MFSYLLSFASFSYTEFMFAFTSFSHAKHSPVATVDQML